MGQVLHSTVTTKEATVSVQRRQKVRCSSTTLAEKMQVSASSMAPDIVEAILNGR